MNSILFADSRRSIGGQETKIHEKAEIALNSVQLIKSASRVRIETMPIKG